MEPRLVTELSGDQLVEGIERVRATLVQQGIGIGRVAVNSVDWPIIEPKLAQFCDDNLVPGFFVPSPISAVLSLAVYITDEVPRGTINVGPWMDEELRRRVPV